MATGCFVHPLGHATTGRVPSSAELPLLCPRHARSRPAAQLLPLTTSLRDRNRRLEHCRNDATRHRGVLLTTLDDQERIAALHRDVPALERLWSKEFIVNAPNNEVVAGRRAVLDTFVVSGVINFSRFDRRIELVREDGEYVIVMGLETIQPISDAPGAGLAAGRTIERRFTNVWNSEDGTWRLFVRHANLIPNRTFGPAAIG